MKFVYKITHYGFNIRCLCYNNNINKGLWLHQIHLLTVNTFEEDKS